MSAGDVVLLGLGVLLVLVAGGLACLETALSRVPRVRVTELVREQARGADRLARVMTDPPRYLNLLLLLRVAAELGATAVVAVFWRSRLDAAWEAASLTCGIMTVVSYIFVGVAPRTVGRQQAPRVALRAAGATLGLARLLGPLPRLLIALGNALTPGRGFRDGPFANEAELRDLVDLAEERKVIERGEREMIHSVFELGDTLVREVMVPRTEMVFIERGRTARQGLTLALRSGFSRVPVVGENVDDVVGVVYLKDLARRAQEVPERDWAERVEAVMRPVSFVPDSKPVDVLLREMQAQQIHIAVVIDEYGGTAGLVTIEDVIEEIVGEITDEYDREAPPVEQVDELTARVTARLPVHQLNEIYGVRLPTNDAETVGGLLATTLGRVPIPGATTTLEGLTLTAESAAGRRNRIGTVLVARQPTEQAEPDERAGSAGPPEPAGSGQAAGAETAEV